MKQVKIKIKDSYMQGFVQLINNLLTKKYEEDEDRLIMANLAELRYRMEVKMLRPQVHYTMTLTPAQALAVRLLYITYVNDRTTAMGNFLGQIADTVHQAYQ